MSNLLRCKVDRVLGGSFWLHQSSQLYVLSLDVPAKPGIIKALIWADDFGRKADADFTDSLLVENLPFTAPLNATS